MYAVVEVLGKQYRAETGKKIWIDRYEAQEGDVISFDKVLLLSGDAVKIGTPYVAGAVVKAKVEEEVKDDKITVFKYKPKKDYRRKQGHRQRYTVVTVQEITGA